MLMSSFTWVMRYSNRVCHDQQEMPGLMGLVQVAQ